MLAKALLVAASLFVIGCVPDKKEEVSVSCTSEFKTSEAEDGTEWAVAHWCCGGKCCTGQGQKTSDTWDLKWTCGPGVKNDVLLRKPSASINSTIASVSWVGDPWRYTVGWCSSGKCYDGYLDDGDVVFLGRGEIDWHVKPLFEHPPEEWQAAIQAAIYREEDLHVLSMIRRMEKEQAQVATIYHDTTALTGGLW